MVVYIPQLLQHQKKTEHVFSNPVVVHYTYSEANLLAQKNVRTRTLFSSLSDYYLKDSSLVQLQNMFLDFNKFNWKGSTLTWQKTDCPLTSEHGLRLNEKPHKVFQCTWSSRSHVCHLWLSQAQTLTHCCLPTGHSCPREGIVGSGYFFKFLDYVYDNRDHAHATNRFLICFQCGQWLYFFQLEKRNYTF